MTSLVDRFHAWTAQTLPRKPFIVFRIAFASIWLAYDVIDLVFRQTTTYFAANSDSLPAPYFVAVQVALVLLDLGLLLGWRPRAMAFGVFLARCWQISLFPLNDFVYAAVAALLLAQSDSSGERGSGGALKPALAWPRDVFVLQTAWIYFATGLLKLNPTFLSGGDLYVRQNYVASLNPHYPAFYRELIASLSANAWLAWLGASAELVLAAALAGWIFLPARRRGLRKIAVALALAIHGYAALTVNVFFFGASMVAQVVAFTWLE